ncbi:MAG TPA: ATP-binding protein, partial [Cystobacter sp.]
GQLIAHPELELEGATVGYDIQGTGAPTGEGRPPRFASEAQRAHLRALFERVKNRQPGEVILELPEFGEYLAVARLHGPEWNFVTVLPKSVVSSAAFSASRYVLVFGVASLVLELLIMFWVLRREISHPLKALTQAAHSVAAGDFQVELGSSRGDELGVLAGAFRMMADKVQQREEELRKANEGLEHRVEERTRELKEVHQQLVKTARQAGMAEIATNVLHNVGNVLNSVYTSAQVARERLSQMRLEQVGRVAGLLTERQGDLATFLTEDTRGRNLMPFLNQLGQLARAFELMAREVRQREEALRQANEGLEQRVEERTRELKDVHQQLMRTARQAGMAEIATNVLHNVGNVLNSVYTAAQLARERMSGMKLEHVGRVARMLQEHQGELTTFATQDERGRHLLPFLDKLGQNLLDEREAMLELLGDIGRYTEHIGDIVKVQQNHARMPRLREPVSLAELVEDALRINASGFSRHEVKVERQLAPLPPVLTDKHKVLMILVNLLSNAKYAMDVMPPEERRLAVKLELCAADRVRIEVRDTGMGIAPELLTRIFQYGFTTRQNGHGFGLHSSALAAQELGGSLTVHSEGAGRGATFVLELLLNSARLA